MLLRELYTTFIFEGPADVVKSLRANYPNPNQVDLINKNYEWIKQTFPKGAEWYMLLVGAQLSGDQNKLQTRLGGYAFTSFEQLQQDLAHFSTLDYQPIKDYAFNNKPVKQVFDELTALETRWKNLPSRPVQQQPNDRILKDYGNGIQWWFVDRGYCEEEGRSGKHCGNVTGKEETDQRILSLRHKMNVVLTFIYLPDGRLGEMKAKGNQKPSEHYHSYVMDLLLGNLGIDVTGITGAGWGPEFNFSIFDLDDKNLNLIMQTKPSFVSDQIEATPREILKAPDVIKNNPEYQQLAVSKQPTMRYFFVNGKVDTSHAAWERAIADEPYYIIYAPVDIKNYRSRVIEQLLDDPSLFLEAPRHIIKDEELVIEVGTTNFEALENIPPAGLTPKVINAVISNDGAALGIVPEELRTPHICKLAVSNSGAALYHVPEALRTLEICKIAVSDSNLSSDYAPALSSVPDNLKTLELCKLAVSKNAKALRAVPDNLKTLELCKTAVSNDGLGIRYISEKIFEINEYVELCKTAVSNNGTALRHIPDELKTPDICKTAVSNNGTALYYIPDELKTPDICKTAVSNKMNVLTDVPHEFITFDLLKAAVNGYTTQTWLDSNKTPLHLLNTTNWLEVLSKNEQDKIEDLANQKFNKIKEKPELADYKNNPYYKGIF